MSAAPAEELSAYELKRQKAIAINQEELRRLGIPHNAWTKSQAETDSKADETTTKRRKKRRKRTESQAETDSKADETTTKRRKKRRKRTESQAETDSKADETTTKRRKLGHPMSLRPRPIILTGEDNTFEGFDDDMLHVLDILEDIIHREHDAGQNESTIFRL